MDLEARLRSSSNDWIARLTDLRRRGFLAQVARRLTGASPNSLPAYWYRTEPNFGDLISPVILRGIWGIEPLHVTPRFKGKLLAVGSILGSALPGDIVWGSGLIRPKPIDGRAVTFLAVRGPRTRAQIDGDVPTTYGDPAPLLPRIYQPQPTTRRHAIGLIPHYADRSFLTSEDPSVPVIGVQNPDWRATIDQIVSCELIISSSLHGIVVAEAYGVPAVWVQPSDRVLGGRFKFVDYYESTGREGIEPADFALGLKALAALATDPPRLDASHLVVSAASWRRDSEVTK